MNLIKNCYCSKNRKIEETITVLWIATQFAWIFIQLTPGNDVTLDWANFGPNDATVARPTCSQWKQYLFLIFAGLLWSQVWLSLEIHGHLHIQKLKKKKKHSVCSDGLALYFFPRT